MKPLQVLPTIQLGTFIFLICCYLIVTIKVKQRSDFLIWFSTRPPPPLTIPSWVVCEQFSFLEDRTSCLLKFTENSVQAFWNKSHMKGKEDGLRERMEKHTELHKHFNFQMNTGKFLTCGHTYLWTAGCTHKHCPSFLPLLNQGGLTLKVPSLKPENHLSWLHVIHLLMHSFHTHLVNTYHVPCTRLAIKTTVVRETDPGNRPLEAYSLDSRGENTINQTITWKM